MRQRTDIYPYDMAPRLSWRNKIEDIEKYLTDFWGQPALVMSSARVGIYLALKFFQLARWHHILVPDYTCQSILGILNASSFPVKKVDERTKAVLLLHQWGYPQDMAKVMPEILRRQLIVIEDCAHAFDSRYQGQLVGTFGDLSVFSFSKMMTTYIGGVVSSHNPELIKFIQAERQIKRPLVNKLFNEIAFAAAKKSFTQYKWQSLLDIIYLRSIHYPNISARALRLLPFNRPDLLARLQARKNNYSYLKNNLKPECIPIDHCPDIDVNPMCLPVFVPLEKIEILQKKLLNHRISAEILHFDVKRNIFEPDYKKCLALPCHQHLSESQLTLITDLINHS